MREVFRLKVVILCIGTILVLFLVGLAFGKIVFSYSNEPNATYVPKIVYVNNTIFVYSVVDHAPPSWLNVSFEKGFVDGLNSFDNTTEWLTCVNGGISFSYNSDGSIKTRNYVLSSIQSNSKQVVDHVSSVCVGGIFAMLHSHPNGDCRASDGDIKVWMNYAKYGTTVFLIRCGERKFAFFHQEDYSRGYIYEI